MTATTKKVGDSDPNPDWIRIQLGLLIRIWIEIRNLIRKAKMTHKKDISLEGRRLLFVAWKFYMEV
jgi:hypothetical protein